MDSRIQRAASSRPLKSGQAGRRGAGSERQFVVPRRPDADAEDLEGEDASESEDLAQGDTVQLDNTVLAPQPRRTSVSISRERLEDEAGQRIDLRG